MRVYKVLRKDAHGKRWSLLTGSHVENSVGAEATDFKIQYYVTKPSVARSKALELGYGITVFYNRLDCLRFCSFGTTIDEEYSKNKIEIWECEVEEEDVMELQLQCQSTGYKFTELIRFKQNKRINKKLGWPEGTIMVKKLQLKRKILRRKIYA